MTVDEPITDLAARIAENAEARREDLVALCTALVAARSVNPEGDTRAVAAVALSALTGLGLSPRLERRVETMPSVIAELDSGRPGPHLVLNVHLDTMPPGDESAWSVPIWDLTRRDGRLYGLGMGNMKGAVAAMVTAAGLLNENRDAWRGRITFTAVSDEVVFGENGAAYLLREHPHLYGDGLICGEGPGFRRLGIGEKGVLWLELNATGDAGHSSSVKRGRSATARLAAAVAQVDALNGVRPEAPPELAGYFTVEHDPGFELTANVGTIDAGTFVGQVAIDGRAEIDLRLPPGIDTDAAEAMVARIAESVGEVTVRRIKGWDPNWTSPHNALARAWNHAAGLLGTAEPEYAIRLPASDASRWRHEGIPALCFGPQPTLSAGIDDYAEEDEVVRCVSLYTMAAIAFLNS